MKVRVYYESKYEHSIEFVLPENMTVKEFRKLAAEHGVIIHVEFL